MLLSEAIRLGAMLRPQIFSGHTRTDKGTCAFGSALDAVGDSGSYCAAVNHWDYLGKNVVHPATGNKGWIVLSIIRDLNDSHKWTRERIADWVESIERERGLIPTREDVLITQASGMLEVLAAVKR